jgi:hypothetical protein
MDVGSGNKTWQQAGLDFGKSLASAAVSVGMGELGNGIMGQGPTAMLDDAGKAMVDAQNNVMMHAATGLMALGDTAGGILARTAWTGVQTWTTTAANSAINAFHLDKDGNLAWDANPFGVGAFGLGAISSVASSMTGYGVTASLDTGVFGFYGALYANGKTLNATVGGLASAGVGYALTGNATFNVLNTSDFGWGNFGLLEMSFGKNGFSSQIGMGGTNLSMSTLGSALKGLETWEVNARMAASGQTEASEYAAGLRTLYSANQIEGKETEAQLFDEILAGKTNITYDKNGKQAAVTTLDANGNWLITLGAGSDAFRNGLGLGVILSHEAYRDGIVSEEVAQRMETDRAAISHMQTAMLLEGTYGIGSIGGVISKEANDLRKAIECGGTSTVG